MVAYDPINNYLNWKDLLVNQVAGGVEIFIALLLIGLLYVAGKYRFPNQVTIGIMIIGLLYIATLMPSIVVLIIIFVAAFFAFALGRAVVGNR